MFTCRDVAEAALSLHLTGFVHIVHTVGEMVLLTATIRFPYPSYPRPFAFFFPRRRSLLIYFFMYFTYLPFLFPTLLPTLTFFLRRPYFTTFSFLLLSSCLPVPIPSALSPSPQINTTSPNKTRFMCFSWRLLRTNG